ncbi:T-complex protein 1 subunit zeta [Pancytospora epiphaga]|nr:T-complex protein 1 subunit zeta [Pancytospora epiphaga]
MQSTSSEAQVTQAGQAISINNATCSQLFELFSSMLGPHGNIKALVNGGQQLSLTKDGYSLCREVPFSHPTSILITRAATSLYASTGDGTISFILMCCDIFNHSYRHYCDGTKIPVIINSLQLAMGDAIDFLQKQVEPLTENNLRELALSSLRTKVLNSGPMADMLVKALLGISASGALDADMVEVIKMEGGDIRDSIFVDGLVLDHSGRHYAMPNELTNVCVMITNMSLEYEKPEINAEYCYSSAAQREELAATEREFILSKAVKIADFARELKKEGKSLIVINEKGIDTFSLEVLSEAGVLGLRRAKRRNLERLVRMCGGKIITQVSQISRECLGVCKRVYVKDLGEEKFTFLEGTPNKGACTILLRGNSDYGRLCKAIRGALNSLVLAIKSKCCIRGGFEFYRKMADFLNGKAREVHAVDAVGYQILGSVYEDVIKVLLRNEGANINERMAMLFRKECGTAKVIENAKVLGSVLNNSVVTAINLLMCDEIIKAGKAIKQDNMENK